MLHRPLTVALSALTVLAVAMPMTALAAGNSNQPGAPGQFMADMAGDLGVTSEQFATCFQKTGPGPQGNGAGAAPDGKSQPRSGEKPPEPPREGQGNPPGASGELLTCLQNANADITVNALQKVMEKHRPDGAGGPGQNGAPPKKN